MNDISKDKSDTAYQLEPISSATPYDNVSSSHRKSRVSSGK